MVENGEAGNWEFVLPDPDTMNERLKAHQITQAYCLQFLEEGVDYQYIPGTGSMPTLCQSGALKLMGTLKLTADYEILVKEFPPEVATRLGTTHNYTVECQLIKVETGQRLTNNFGSGFSEENAKERALVGAILGYTALSGSFLEPGGLKEEDVKPIRVRLWQN